MYNSSNQLEQSTYYVLDAQGDAMGVYEREVDNVVSAAMASGKYSNAKDAMEAVSNILTYRVKTNKNMTINQIGEKYLKANE